MITLVFPLTIAIGAGASVTPKIRRLCRISGDLSYPLYTTHYGVIWIWGDYATKQHLLSRSLWTAVALGVSLMVAFAWAVPHREWLIERLLVLLYCFLEAHASSRHGSLPNGGRAAVALVDRR